MASVGRGGTPGHVGVEFCAREEELAGGGEMLDVGRGMGRKWGLGWSFIGGQGTVDGRRAGHGILVAFLAWALVAFHRACAIDGSKKGKSSRRRKERERRH